MSIDLGKLERVPLRELWPHEAVHFSQWLSNNLDRLGEALGLELTAPELEVGVGSFSVDIVAHDESRNRKVIIENQLERTDHDHLGKIITYASGLAADVVIWISPEFREEHRSALDWLNINTVEDREFFGVQLEAWKIDNSRAAPIFKPVATPNDWQKRLNAGRTRNPQALRQTEFFNTFFSEFAEQLRAVGFQRVGKPGDAAWLIVDRWSQNFHVAVSFSRTRFQAGLFLASANPELNRMIFDTLQAKANEIETSLGFLLTWDFNSERVRQSMWTSIDAIDREDPLSLDRARKWGLSTVLQMKDILKPYVTQALLTSGTGESLI